MKPVTAGERLFILIRDQVLDSIGHEGFGWSRLGVLFEHVGGTPEFSDYMRGAVSVHAMRRLLRFWEEGRKETADESAYVRQVRKFIKNEVFPELTEHLTGQVSRAVIAAEAVSFKTVTKTVYRNVVGERNRLRCYLCNRELDPSKSKGDESHATMEHLWPTSIGGDSIEENLLPACSKCQDDTKDTMSWEWLNVHNVVLPIFPSEKALTSIARKIRVAKHFQYAISIANRERLTLKEALLKIGPIKPRLSHVKTGVPVTFFDLQTV